MFSHILNKAQGRYGILGMVLVAALVLAGRASAADRAVSPTVQSLDNGFDWHQYPNNTFGYTTMMDIWEAQDAALPGNLGSEGPGIAPKPITGIEGDYRQYSKKFDSKALLDHELRGSAPVSLPARDPGYAALDDTHSMDYMDGLESLDAANGYNA